MEEGGIHSTWTTDMDIVPMAQFLRQKEMIVTPDEVRMFKHPEDWYPLPILRLMAGMQLSS